MKDGKKLYRSHNNKMIAGVCSGIGKYFNVDPTVIRLLFVLLSLAVLPGFLLYIIAWILMPEEP